MGTRKIDKQINYSHGPTQTKQQVGRCAIGTTLRLLQLWGPITLRANLRSKWSLKQICNLRQKLSNDMWYTTCTQGSQGDSQLLVVGSQIANLTSGPSFGHNLCFNYPNGSCKLILDIYVSIDFQWYKEVFNLMGFNPCNCSLKIWKSIETPIPKVGTLFGSVRVHSLTLSYTFGSMRCDSSWPSPLQAFAFVANPRLGLQHQW
jgi:hypothetical protein